MKQVGFIGAYDKTDFILYLSKIITMLKKKVLVIDSTINQKARYIVPSITPTVKNFTDFEDIDVAVGFKNYKEIKDYIGITEEQKLEYDYIFVDVDTQEGLENFNLKESYKNYFVTSFDNYSLKKGLECFSGVKDVMSLTKVLFAHQILKEEDDYLNFLTLGYKIAWNEHRIYFPLENGDLSAIYENHRVAKIKFRRLSVQFKDSLSELAVEILSDVSETSIRRIIKIIEKGA